MRWGSQAGANEFKIKKISKSINRSIFEDPPMGNIKVFGHHVTSVLLPMA